MGPSEAIAAFQERNVIKNVISLKIAFIVRPLDDLHVYFLKRLIVMWTT